MVHSQSDSQAATDERGGEAAGPQRNLGAWILLFGALAASAGHGLFLYARLTLQQWIPDFGHLLRVLGPLGTAVVCWFLLSVPLALGALLLRRPLQRQAWLWPAALLAALAGAGAFTFYARMMLAAASGSAAA